MRKTAIVFISMMFVVIPLIIANAEVSEEVLKIQQMIEENGLKWTAGQTSMMDLPLEERQMRLGLEIPDDVRARFEALNDTPPPVLLSTQEYFNWDEFGCVSVVDDQRDCGSCWAFAATHAFESAYIIAEGIVPDFSEQQALVCNYGGSSCNGGWMAHAYNVFIGYGAVEESCMPYYANDDYPCTQEDCVPVAYLDGYEDIPNNVNAIKNALMLGPLSTTFTVYDDFYSYRNGCYEHADVQPLNHAVVIVGWDDDMCDGEGAWIVKNSWGTNFGWDGFFYMKYNSSGFGQHTQRPIYGTAGLPQFTYSPEEIIIDVPSGEQITMNLVFNNTGSGLLRYNLSPTQPDGQDEFGYYCINSDDPEGPAYDWIDITEIGEQIEFPFDIDDGNSGWLQLGFDFNYYENSYNRLKACTNGWITFMDGYFVNSDNLGMPDRTLPNNLLAVFWDDLNFEYSGQAYFYTNNQDTAIVTWQNVADSRNEARYTFQVVLVAPDKITYQYADMGPDRLDECTIGMENRTATIGLEVVRNESYVADQLAVGMFLGDSNALDWLAIDADIGVVEPDATELIPLTFLTADLEEGTYTAVLKLLTNDYNMLVNEIPVTLNVGTVGIDETKVNLPDDFSLNPVYPNPFNAEATISYNLLRAENVTVEVYNLIGQRVAVLYDGFQSAGEHSLSWQASDYASGIYQVKLSNGEMSRAVQVTLLK